MGAAAARSFSIERERAEEERRRRGRKVLGAPPDRTAFAAALEDAKKRGKKVLDRYLVGFELETGAPMWIDEDELCSHGCCFAKTGVGWPIGKRARAIGNILRNGPEIARSLIETRCTQGAKIARLLRFSEAVAQGIAALDEHWDGGGKPLGLAGEAIPLPARIALLAQVADVFFTNGGPSAARAEIARHSGRWFDPALCEAFGSISASAEFWVEVGATDLATRILALEPDESRIAMDEDYLDDIAMAFGQVIDAKSPYTGGHSERVGFYCDAVAAEVGIPAGARRQLRRAATTSANWR